MARSSLLVVGLTLLLLTLPAVPVCGDEPTGGPAFEVLVVGTIHAPWQFRSRKFHPGHVRAALEVAKPDVIGVESNPTWFAKGASTASASLSAQRE